MSVYKGDLTNERVDVIVNPSNNRLRHEGGMAKALLDRGGKVIEVESNMIMAKRKLLKDGEAAITNSGYLPCEKIVHAVGPDFRNVGLPQSRIVLRRACLNSLIIAQQWKMTSIALPAIGSGACGMPKDECAKVMFDAVEEFVKQGNPKKKTITDIRFVNIDDLSVQAFRMEFISRYENNQDHSDSKNLTEGKSFKAPSNVAGGATFSLQSPPRSNRGKNKKEQSSHNGRKAKNPSDAVDSHGYNAFGSTNASAGHPLNNPNSLSLSPTSYSDAVKTNTGGESGVRSSPAQEPGSTSNTGFHLFSRNSTDREDAGKAYGTKYTKNTIIITISSDDYRVIMT